MRSRSRSWSNVIAAVIVYVGLALIFTAISSFFLMLIWNWTVPDLFSGLVAKNYVPGYLSLFDAFKLSLLLWLLKPNMSNSSKSDK